MSDRASQEVEITVEPAPDWVGKDALKDFLYWHGTGKNLKRILKFVNGQPRRDVTEISFAQADMVRARIDTGARQVTFFDPHNALVPTSTLDFDEVADLFAGYIKLGGYPDRSTDEE